MLNIHLFHMRAVLFTPFVLLLSLSLREINAVGPAEAVTPAFLDHLIRCSHGSSVDGTKRSRAALKPPPVRELPFFATRKDYWRVHRAVSKVCHRWDGLRMRADNGGAVAKEHETNIPEIDRARRKEVKRGDTLVENFRQAASLPGIYRCASTDRLGYLFPTATGARERNEADDVDGVGRVHADIVGAGVVPSGAAAATNGASTAEEVLLARAGLVLDLRSPSERDEDLAARWMGRATGGAFEVRDLLPSPRIGGDDDTHDVYGYVPLREGIDDDDEVVIDSRTVLRIDVLSPSKLFAHLSSKWLSPAQRALSSLYFAVDANKLHELRMDTLNERGLPGLYEAILQTSQKELQLALQAITVHMENTSPSHGAVVIHCVQGKDRTGLLIMLCQAIVGLSDEGIIEEYHLSETFLPPKQGSAAASDAVGGAAARGKLDRRKFSGAPKYAMESALRMLEKQYGSVCPGYLDSIGFGEGWRRRFRDALSRASRTRSGGGRSRL